MYLTPDDKAGALHFAENLRLFSNTTTQAEKFNLYGGLKNMALIIHQQNDRIAGLEKQLQEIIKLLKSK